MRPKDEAREWLDERCGRDVLDQRDDHRRHVGALRRIPRPAPGPSVVGRGLGRSGYSNSGIQRFKYSPKSGTVKSILPRSGA